MDANGRISLSDPILILEFLFGDTIPACRAAADIDGDATVGVEDAVLVLGYLFNSGTPPAAPFPRCGVDPRVHRFGDVDCEGFTACP